ncbi:MAG: hypothetical protein AB2462_08945 [Thermoanaerobacter sp.]|uniref:hypothetical protein n=1 Tax=Thermoanaerobacter sp. TaxID=1755 RepID=UPI0034643096
MNNKIKQLEYLKSRLKKAYSLPLSEQQKWKKQIEELENEISQIENELGIYTQDKALKLLMQAIQKLSASLAWEGINFNEFFTKYPELGKKQKEAETKVEKVFKTGGLTVFEKALKDYIDVYIEINSVFNSKKEAETYEQLGFHLLTPDDPEYAEAVEVFKNWNAN